MSSPSPKASRIVVVGGGIAGLTAAFRLTRLREQQGLDFEVTLLESSGRFGGKIKTDRSGGMVIEAGPDAFLTTKPDAVALVRELGLGDQLIGTAREERDVYVYAGGRLRRLPDGLLLMAPSKVWPFLASDIVSWRAKLRMGLEVLVPRADRIDESLADFTRRRLGSEALETIVDPLMAGIFAGDSERLSLRSTFPQFAELERRYGSVIRGLRASAGANGTGKATLTAFASLTQGLEGLVEELCRRLGPSVLRSGVGLKALHRESRGYRVVTDEGPLHAEAVILALPAAEAATALAPLDSELAGSLQEIQTVSTATVTLGFEGSALPSGFGFVVPKRAGLTINAATFVSQKFPGRGYPLSVVRCFLGGAGKEHLPALSDDELLARVSADLRRVAGLQARPKLHRIFRWPKANPQYEVGHSARLGRIKERLSAFPGLSLAGASYGGVGIPDCIRSGNEAAVAAAAQAGHRAERG